MVVHSKNNSALISHHCRPINWNTRNERWPIARLIWLLNLTTVWTMVIHSWKSVIAWECEWMPTVQLWLTTLDVSSVYSAVNDICTHRFRTVTCIDSAILPDCHAGRRGSVHFKSLLYNGTRVVVQKVSRLRRFSAQRNTSSASLLLRYGRAMFISRRCKRYIGVDRFWGFSEISSNIAVKYTVRNWILWATFFSQRVYI